MVYSRDKRFVNRKVSYAMELIADGCSKEYVREDLMDELSFYYVDGEPMTEDERYAYAMSIIEAAEKLLGILE